MERSVDLIRTFESFVRVVKAGSFAGAAKQMGASRAMISKHMQDLETHLQARLFHRTTRRLSLTEAGASYYEFCVHILSEIEEKRTDIAVLQHEPRGTLKLMAPKSFGNLRLAPLIADFVALYPELHVTMLLTDDSLNTYDLVDHGIDLAIRLSPATQSSAIARRIGALQWILCASPSYLAQHKSPRTPADLRKHNCLIHLKSSADNVWRFTGPKGQTTATVSGSFSANSSMALRAGALRGLGIAMLPDYCVDDALASGALRRVLPGYRLAERPFFVVYPHKRNLPHKVRLMVEFLSEKFKNGTETKVLPKKRKRPLVRSRRTSITDRPAPKARSTAN
jgi:DNA-binding transcriptional LysR family regulator